MRIVVSQGKRKCSVGGVKMWLEISVLIINLYPANVENMVSC